MELLDLVKKIVDPPYTDDHGDVTDGRVTKRVKTFPEQVKNGVEEMEVTSEFIE